MLAHDPDTADGTCPACEKPYRKRVVSKFGGTINHQTELKQDRTCFWSFEHPDGVPATAVYYHIDQLPDDETIDLSHGDD